MKNKKKKQSKRYIGRPEVELLEVKPGGKAPGTRRITKAAKKKEGK